MPGLSKYDDKAKRAQRRRNHVARDLATDKYHQRVVPAKKKAEYQTDYTESWHVNDALTWGPIGPENDL